MLRRQERKLKIKVTDSLRIRMLDVARQFDINKGGHYDGSGGMVVNVWCAPDDKPVCWDVPINQGGLDYPREFVGTIRFELLTDDTYQLELEALPYELYRERERPRKPSEAELGQCLNWIEVKAQELLRLADLHPDIVGLKCPFCNYIHPTGELLNDMLTHIQDVHGTSILGLTLSDPPYITVDGGAKHNLEPAEQFV
jgi:hypothetical protein